MWLFSFIFIQKTRRGLRVAKGSEVRGLENDFFLIRGQNCYGAKHRGPKVHFNLIFYFFSIFFYGYANALKYQH